MKNKDHLPHDVNVLVSPDDSIQLEPWPDGKWEAKLRNNIHIELVLVFVRAETRHGREKGGVCLVEVWI